MTEADIPIKAARGYSIEGKDVRKLWMEKVRNDATIMMEKRLRKCKGRSIKATSKILEGSPVEKLVLIASDEKVDLIVIGSRGHGTLKKVLLGSVSSVISRVAPCPVLICR